MDVSETLVRPARRDPSRQLKPNTVKSIDHVPPNAPESSDRAHLLVFATKGSRPHMRHVSRTHRVNLDCLFGTFNSNIQVTYVSTTQQVSDMLVKGAFFT